MSDWGKVLFYYDYECVNKYMPNDPRRIKGVISKSYNSPGTEGMILHAFYGLEYFLRRKEGLYDFSLGHESWEELNTAFDIFFDLHNIDLGSDSVKRIIDNKEKDIEYELIDCEGLYGWIFISFTGNKNNNKLKYGYFAPGKDRVIKSLRDALKEDGRWERLNPRKAMELINPMLEFFEKEATLITTEEEFWDIGKQAAKCVNEYLRQ